MMWDGYRPRGMPALFDGGSQWMGLATLTTVSLGLLGTAGQHRAAVRSSFQVHRLSGRSHSARPRRATLLRRRPGTSQRARPRISGSPLNWSRWLRLSTSRATTFSLSWPTAYALIFRTRSEPER